MSVSSSAKVIIGFEVLHEDFWDEKESKDDFVSCENGHKGGQEGKFCSECGEEFAYQEHNEIVCNPNFAKFVGDSDPEGKAGEAWNPSICRSTEDQFGSGSDCWPDGFDLYCADQVSGSDDEDEVRVIGMAPLKVGDIGGGGSWGNSKDNTLDEKQIDHYIGEARDLANKLGIDRPPMLYLACHCSY
jgi:hypothetical protein